MGAGGAESSLGEAGSAAPIGIDSSIGGGGSWLLGGSIGLVFYSCCSRGGGVFIRLLVISNSLLDCSFHRLSYR